MHAIFDIKLGRHIRDCLKYNPPIITHPLSSTHRHPHYYPHCHPTIITHPLSSTHTITYTATHTTFITHPNSHCRSPFVPSHSSHAQRVASPPTRPSALISLPSSFSGVQGSRGMPGARGAPPIPGVVVWGWGAVGERCAEHGHLGSERIQILHAR